MQKKGPLNFPSEILLLTELGERLKLARLRRRYTTTLVAKRCGISRTTLTKIEKGDPSVTLGAYLRVLSVLGLADDIAAIAADDKLGRKLQDLELTAPKGAKS